MESHDGWSVPSERGRAGLRASDADREQIATLLRESFTAGRLTIDELEDRLARAYRSRFLGELDSLVRDLPVGSDHNAFTSRRPRRSRTFHVPGFVLLAVIVVAIWAVIATLHFFPIFPLIFFWFFFGRGWRRRTPAYIPSRPGPFHDRFPGR